MEREILDRLDAELTPVPLPQWPDGSLFHYTNAEGLHGILTTRTIWATHCRFLNDAAEVTIGEQLVFDVATELAADARRDDSGRWLLGEFLARYEDQRITERRDVFVASFTERGDLLSQWRAYATGGGGYSIGFSHIPPPRAPEGKIGLGLFQCRYTEASVRADATQLLGDLVDRYSAEARAHVKNEADRNQLAGLFVALLFRRAALLALHLKHPAFEEEREWRLVALATGEDPTVSVAFRAGRQGLVPYIAVPLTEGPQMALSALYIGPTMDPSRGTAAATMLLNRLGYSGGTIVVPSRIPFRDV